ncbi:MAG: metallophosphoesterase [Candidatus Woesearchaeota archaeon]
MRLLFFTDIHGSEKYLNEIIRKSHDADVLVCTGDLTIFEDNLDYILKKLNSIGKTVILINGNHESESTMAALCMRYKNLKFIHKSHYIIEDIIFFGYGGGGFSVNDSSFDKASEIFIKEYDKISKRENKNFKLILLTHAPPYGTNIDNISGDIEYHVGCRNIFEFIKKYQPLIAVSGHIHEAFELEDRIDKTLILNPGPRGKILFV